MHSIDVRPARPSDLSPESSAAFALTLAAPFVLIAMALAVAHIVDRLRRPRRA
jgi:hypothetical protein